MMRAVKKLAPLRCPKLHMTRPQGEYTSTPTRNTLHHWQSASLAQRQPLLTLLCDPLHAEIKVGLSGDTTVRSKAADLPQSQLEARMSAGRVFRSSYPAKNSYGSIVVMICDYRLNSKKFVHDDCTCFVRFTQASYKRRGFKKSRL